MLPELRWEHNFDNLAYDGSNRHSQFLLASDIIWFYNHAKDRAWAHSLECAGGSPFSPSAGGWPPEQRFQLQSWPKPRIKNRKKEKKIAAGEKEAKNVLLLMDQDQNGKVSKQEFMSFMEAGIRTSGQG